MANISKACSQLERSDATLTLLNLNCECIGSNGAQKLAKSCRSCHITSRKMPNRHSPLVALWLENNFIYAKGAEAISQVLEASPSLKYLYMSRNSINNSGVAELFPAASRQLEVFHIGDNKIGPEGARAIAGVLLDESSTVSTLVLDSNHVRDQGAAAIAECLRQNTSLVALDLRYNRIGKEGMAAFLEVLKRDNKTLQSLLLEEDHYDENCTRSPPRRRGNKSPRLMIPEKGQCSCELCQMRGEINYYLALNRAGRHSFADPYMPATLWPRIMARASEADPSLMYTMLAYYKPELSTRPCDRGTICIQ